MTGGGIYSVLDSFSECERQRPDKDMFETDEAHFEIALGPSNPSRLAKFGTGRQ